MNIKIRNLHIRVLQLEAAATNERSRLTKAPKEIKFRRDDRVQIKNKLKTPAAWSSRIPWNKELAQCATVTNKRATIVPMT